MLGEEWLGVEPGGLDRRGVRQINMGVGVKSDNVVFMHCNIKALFSVLGGGLPQFNTSDLFLGRESLSYVPPDI